LAQRQDHWEQTLAFGSERVDDSAAVFGIRSALEDPSGDHLAQPVGQDVARNPEPGLELLEMLQTVECAAKDQEGPLFADQFDRLGQGAPQRSRAEGINV
jgi:hypothetical protein